MRVDLMEELLERLEKEGKRPKFIYTVPSFQNPGGVTMSLPRRKRLVEVAREKEILILEDNPYGLLRYEGDPLPTLRSLDKGVYTMYLGTFSKILSPGSDWAGSPPRLRCSRRSTSASGGGPLQLHALPADGARLLRAWRWRDYVDSLTEIYRARRDTMLDALAEFLPRESEWTRPAGGLFIWVTLPDYIDTTDLLARALRDNVAFVPGEAAYLDGRGRSSMRLNFSGVDEDSIREGVRRIGKVVEEQVALYGTLTGPPRRRARARGACAAKRSLAEPEAGARVVRLPTARDRARRAGG